MLKTSVIDRSPCKSALFFTNIGRKTIEKGYNSGRLCSRYTKKGLDVFKI